MGPWAEELHALRAAGVEDLLVRLDHAPEHRWRVAECAAAAGLFAWVRAEFPDDAARAKREGTGLHLPARWSPGALALGSLPWTAACHDEAALARASGATAVLVSPVFSPGSKPNDRRTPLGVGGLAEKVQATTVPVLALGGLAARRVGPVIAAGAWGVAGISAFFSGGRVRLEPARALVQAVAEARGVGGLRPSPTPEDP